MSGADNVVWLGTPAILRRRAPRSPTPGCASLCRATGTIRDRRLALVAKLDGWEDLRETAVAVKQCVCVTSTAISCGWKRR